MLNSNDITLDYSDVIDYWEYPYLILQGGTYYNGYLLFNVGSLSELPGYNICANQNVLAINSHNGKIEIVLPLDEHKETEGICVYNEKLYIGFKNGNQYQGLNDVVFSLYEYSLPIIPFL